MEIQSDHSETIDRREPAVLTATRPQPAQGLDPPPSPLPPTPVGTQTVLTSRTSWFTPASLVAGVVAVALLLIGGITVARTGVDGSLDTPVVRVANYTATTLLGFIEIAFGLALLAAALTRSNSTVLFLGITGGVLALVAVFQPSPGRGSLAIERGFALWAATGMAAVVVAALMPTVKRSYMRRRTTDVG